MALSTDFILFITNPIVLSMVISYIISIIIKFSLSDTHRIKSFITFHGGMPSSHSACVSALAVSIYLMEGVSNLFIFSSAFAFVVIIDAVYARHEVGVHAKVINNLLKDNESKLFERIGHRPIEVLAGVCLGLIVTLIVHYVIPYVL